MVVGINRLGIEVCEMLRHYNKYAEGFICTVVHCTHPLSLMEGIYTVS